MLPGMWIGSRAQLSRSIGVPTGTNSSSACSSGDGGLPLTRTAPCEKSSEFVEQSLIQAECEFDLTQQGLDLTGLQTEGIEARPVAVLVLSRPHRKAIEREACAAELECAVQCPADDLSAGQVAQIPGVVVGQQSRPTADGFQPEPIRLCRGRVRRPGRGV